MNHCTHLKKKILFIFFIVFWFSVHWIRHPREESHHRWYSVHNKGRSRVGGALSLYYGMAHPSHSYRYSDLLTSVCQKRRPFSSKKAFIILLFCVSGIKSSHLCFLIKLKWNVSCQLYKKKYDILIPFLFFPVLNLLYTCIFFFLSVLSRIFLWYRGSTVQLHLLIYLDSHYCRQFPTVYRSMTHK